MSVYIKGMEMPKNCYECLVRNQGFSGDGMKCGKTGSVLSWYDGNRKRMGNCPLIPVPKHGRLVDADEYQAKMRNAYDDDWFTVLEAAPTIIPADKEGDNADN